MKPAFRLKVVCFGETHWLEFPEGKDWPKTKNHTEGSTALLTLWSLSGEPKECGCARVLANWRNAFRSPPRLGTFEFRNTVATLCPETSAAHPYVTERLAHAWATAGSRKAIQPSAYSPEIAMANRKEKVKAARGARLSAAFREICRSASVPYGAIYMDHADPAEVFPGTFISKITLKPSVYKAQLAIDVNLWAKFARKNPILGPAREFVVRRYPVEPVSQWELHIPYLLIDFSTARVVARRHVLTIDGESMSETWTAAVDAGPVTKRTLCRSTLP